MKRQFVGEIKFFILFMSFFYFRSSRPERFCKKGVLPASACNFTKKETLAQVFFCEFCKIFKNTFSYSILPVAASVICFGHNYMVKRLHKHSVVMDNIK